MSAGVLDALARALQLDDAERVHLLWAAVGMAELSLDRDDPGGAIPVAEQVLRHLPLANKTQRAAAVELAVRAKSPGLGH